MILNDISPYISIDSIVTENSENYIHFMSHIDRAITIPKDWKSVIYTSPHIFKFLWLKENSIDQKFIRILQRDESTKITLPNNVEVTVTMFEICEITGNVAFHFKESGKSVLYVGSFGMCQEMLINPRFQQYVKSGIHVLYLDNTRANCVIETNEYIVARKLKEILNKHPGYQILLHIPPYGYEELIMSLLLQYGFKICAGRIILELFRKFDLPVDFEMDRHKAQIILGEGCVTMETIKQRFKEKRITVRIIESNNQLVNYSLELNGLYQINWSPHPSLFQLYHLTAFVRPQYLKEIDSNMPKFPEILHHLCIRKHDLQINKNSNNQKNERNIDDNSHYNKNIVKSSVSQIHKKSNTTNDDRGESSNALKQRKIILPNNMIAEKVRKNNQNLNNSRNLIKIKSENRHEANNTSNKNDEVNEIISISSTDSEETNRQQRIRLPRRRTKTKNNNKRIVGIVTPIRPNTDIMNFMEFTTPKNTNTNKTEQEARNLRETEEDSSSSSQSTIDIDELGDADGDDDLSMSTVTDLSLLLQDEQIAEEEASQNVDRSLERITSLHENSANKRKGESSSLPHKKTAKGSATFQSETNGNLENKKKGNKKIVQNVIHEKIRAQIGIKCKRIIYDDDESS